MKYSHGYKRVHSIIFSLFFAMITFFQSACGDGFAVCSLELIKEWANLYLIDHTLFEFM